MVEVGNCLTCVFYKFPHASRALHNQAAGIFPGPVYSLSDICKIGKTAEDVYAPYDSYYRVNMELEDAVNKGFLTIGQAEALLDDDMTYEEYVRHVHFDQPIIKGGFRTEHDVFYVDVYCTPGKTVCPAYQLNPVQLAALEKQEQAGR